MTVEKEEIGSSGSVPLPPHLHNERSAAQRRLRGKAQGALAESRRGRSTGGENIARFSGHLAAPKF
jgi:hypothetical protein